MLFNDFTNFWDFQNFLVTSSVFQRFSEFTPVLSSFLCFLLADYTSVALGSEDGNTYIFRSRDFTRFEEQPPEEIAKCSSQSGPIVQVDWSQELRQGHFIIRTLTRDGVIKHCEWVQFMVSGVQRKAPQLCQCDLAMLLW